LLIGVKTEKKLKVDFVDVEFPSVGDNEKALDTRKLILSLVENMLNHLCQLHHQLIAGF
jgi:hypothetical protein